MICDRFIALSLLSNLITVYSMGNGPFIELVDVSDIAFDNDTKSGSDFGISGIAIFDCNNDGLEDVFYASQYNEPHRLFINEGEFTFSEEAVERGIDSLYGSYGVVAFDFDNNGDIDLVLSWVGPNKKNLGLQFWYNEGDCYFEDRTMELLGSSVVELYSGGGLSVSDYDHDGDLDLFVTAAGSLFYELPHTISGINMIYENTLDPDSGVFTFEKLSRSSPPIPAYIQFSCSSAWEDFDEDGWDDVVFGKCGDPLLIGDATHLWRNNYGENDIEDFQDVSDQYGLGLCNDVGRGPQFPMSISYGHLSDDDDHFDLFTTNAGNPALPTMYEAVWDKKEFQGYRSVDIEGLNEDQFSWGAAFIDLDNDSKDDIIMTGSWRVFGSTNPGLVYRNRVNNKRYLFEETQTLGLEAWSTSMIAYGDLDQDGYLDVAVNTVCDALVGDCTNSVPLKIFKNNGGELNLPNRYYLDISLRGNVASGTNYYGIGSVIKVNVPSFRYSKKGKIRSGTDGGVSNSIFAHFGVVNKNRASSGYYQQQTSVESVRVEVCVEWMGTAMTKECFKGIALNQRLVLTEGAGKGFY